MKSSLRNQIENYPTGMTWGLILIILITIQINSYLIVTYLIPNPIIKGLRIETNGLITPAQIAFIYSILFYSTLAKLLGFQIPEYKKLLSNTKISLILAFTIVIIFTILFSINIDSDSPKNPTVGYFIELLLGAIFEELLFRFLLLGGLILLLKKTLGTKSIWIAIIISSLIFSLGHLFYHIQNNMVQFKFYIVAFLIGILLSWIYVWFNNIILVILLHLIVNLNVLYLPLIKGSTGMINVCWFTIALILAIYGAKIKKIKKTGANARL